MSNQDTPEKINFAKIIEKLQSLELRISRLETTLLKKDDVKDIYLSKEVFDKNADEISYREKESGIETKIGEYGLALLGSLVLIFGVFFLMIYVRNQGYSTFSRVLGYTITASIFVFAYKIRLSFRHLHSMLNISGFLLLYFITAQLHFFTENPLILQKWFALFIILLVIGIQIYFALIRKSEFQAGLAIVLLLATSLLYNNEAYTLSLITMAVVVSVYLFYKRAWWRLLLVLLLFVYLSLFLWLLNNPFISSEVQIISTQQFLPHFLIACATIFSLITLIKQKGLFPDNVFVLAVILNALGFSFVILLVTVTFFEENYANLFGAISLLCILFSVVLKRKTDRKFAPALYASFGFMALSISVYGYVGLPNAYMLLVLQSLLVVSMALWFRSQLIVVANTLLFILILLVYVSSSSSVNSINLVIVVVAILTARFLNWKKERLALKTDMLRNFYLVSAYVFVLYGLYHAIPDKFVTLSWTVAAAIYFIMSILLQNIKYRWMAIATFLATAIYLFVVDLARVEVGYRVIAFLSLAVISISVSLYYTKKIKNKSK